MSKTRYLCFLLILPSILCKPVIAHTSIQQKITVLTELIEQSPNNAKLFLARGELYRVHKDWSKAMLDFDRASKFDTADSEVDFYVGRMLLESNKLAKAEEVLKSFLKRVPDHSGARIIHARALLKLGRGVEAAEEYTHAIELHSNPGPGLYLERAKALIDDGDANVNKALDGLDEGVQKLGQLVSLQLFAIDLELKNKRFNDALCRLEKITEQSSRKETYLTRRGEILEKAGRIDEGYEAYNNALSAIRGLPINQQKTQVIMQLKTRVLDALDRSKKLLD